MKHTRIFRGVYRMCQCPLFKQFTTRLGVLSPTPLVFIVCVNVLFLSNSQHKAYPCNGGNGVYRMCQCPLFKQFTTEVLPQCTDVWCLSYVSMSSF